MRNLSAYPVTKEEKERYLRARLAEWEATPTQEIRFGDLTGAILAELLSDLERLDDLDQRDIDRDRYS